MLLLRLRTYTLWTGTLLSVLIAAAFVASGWWYLGVQLPTGNGPGVGVNGGVFIVTLFQAWGELWVLADSVTARPGGFQPAPVWQWWNVWELGPSGARYVFVPLYAVFLAVAIPTLLFWRFGRKPIKPGHCRCGYDLTGNTSGVCSECGSEIGRHGQSRL